MAGAALGMGAAALGAGFAGGGAGSVQDQFQTHVHSLRGAIVGASAHAPFQFHTQVQWSGTDEEGSSVEAGADSVGVSESDARDGEAVAVGVVAASCEAVAVGVVAASCEAVAVAVVAASCEAVAVGVVAPVGEAAEVGE